MTRTLVLKLLRDYRVGLPVVALLLFLFQLLWSVVAKRISTEVLREFSQRGIDLDMLGNIIFQGPGKIIQSLLGGADIRLDHTQDMLSMAYVHPLTQIILCVWAIGRASGSIAGELDRGTMELLLAQPIRRGQIILAHFLIDIITIPVVCLSMWAGTFVGAHLVGLTGATDPKLQVHLAKFGPALFNVGLLVFAVSGITMAISAAGRYRGRVLGGAVLLALLQFLVNVIGQLWSPMEPLRPYTVFYWYQPQPIILEVDWTVHREIWEGFAVLAAVGTAGYALALWRFTRRDLPAPL
jgi:beta-exotoxin I transport system permease protein